MEIGNELPGLELKNLFIGGLFKKDGTVQNGLTGCMQVNDTLLYRLKVLFVR